MKNYNWKYKNKCSEGKKLIPCWLCIFAHRQIKDQSIIVMVGLFEQWETE